MGSYATDTIPAIDLLEGYYGADVEKEIVGTSVNATEHSVQCAGGKETELDTYRRLITEVYPDGLISIVSDTWDFWNVVSNYLSVLKPEIMARNGKVVIRPDSGDPVEIICGKQFTIVPIDYLYNQDSIESWICDDLVDKVYADTPHGEIGAWSVTADIYQIGDKYFEATVEIEWNRHDKKYYMDGERLTDFNEIELTSAQKGLVECLWDTFGGTMTDEGFKLLDSHIGGIYGDSITYERAEQIFERLAAKGFASGNIVLGLGSYAFQYVTRDTHGMAMKTTYAVINGEPHELFKDPITDNGTKKSAKGLLKVIEENGRYKLIDQVTPEEEETGCLVEIFRDGKLLVEVTLAEVRSRTDVDFE
jgi:nicotinamide phosphoribosyltransferase